MPAVGKKLHHFVPRFYLQAWAKNRQIHCLQEGEVFRAKREIHFAFAIWQARFVNHRICDAEDYKHHHTYIWENPVRADLSERPDLFAWSSASLGMELDAPPPGLKP
jgi:REP element-mobilizing transposase RayT